MNDARLSHTRQFLLVAFGAVTGLIVGVFVPWHSVQAPPVGDGYQAVFLSNNQVYFGKLSELDSPYPMLSDVYYIQALAPQDLSSASKAGQLQLVKLGSELHQPQDVMYLNRDQILFVEPLKAESQIVKSIEQFKSRSN